MAGLTEITDAAFETAVIKNARPTIVKFHATWCGPCKIVAPTIEQLAKDYAGKVDMVSVNIDDAPDAAASMGVTAVPTMVFVKGGEEVGRLLGVQKRDAFVNEIKRLFGV